MKLPPIVLNFFSWDKDHLQSLAAVLLPDLCVGLFQNRHKLTGRHAPRSSEEHANQATGCDLAAGHHGPCLPNEGAGEKFRTCFGTTIASATSS
eukprot:CAMPEP_0183412202 /NCGR_PEP_ID=MMETSP0370-20130417/20855_1 /TAXON_ID=268820 /ORGANISM="Peridinium aciculiferum, Strain PAER-2" /LENGTH=93 /DNA_ID=CAMNT_0025595279 /DNA_START=537 /DNA_END=814 /DNA_ORIENTATION=-